MEQVLTQLTEELKNLSIKIIAEATNETETTCKIHFSSTHKDKNITVDEFGKLQDYLSKQDKIESFNILTCVYSLTFNLKTY